MFVILVVQHSAQRVYWGGGLQSIEMYFWMAAETEHCKMQLLSLREQQILGYGNSNNGSNGNGCRQSALPINNSKDPMTDITTTSTPVVKVCIGQSDVVRKYHQHVQGIIEDVLLTNPMANNWDWLWIFYMRLLILDPVAVKKVYYRAIQACSWSKDVWMQCQGPLRHAFVHDNDTLQLQKFLEQIDNRGFCLRI